MFRRLALVATIMSIGAIAVAAPASAHIDPDPSEAQAGDTVTVGFTVEHGCDGSSTVEIEMRIPTGVDDAIPEPLDGWNESIEEGDDGSVVVAFTGGPLDAETPGTFQVTMTLPPTPDTTIYFPFVQHCEVGEIRWIGIPDQPGEELDEPAPAMDLIGPVVTTTAPPTTESVATTPDPAAPVTASPDTTVTPDTTVAPDTTPEPATTDVGATPTTTPDSNDTDGSSDTGTIIFAISVLAVFLVGGAAWLAARRARANDATTSPTDDEPGSAPTDGTER